MTCGFHQAVQESLQVVIPVRNIWRKGTDSCRKWDLKLKRENRMRMKILPPTNASKLKTRFRYGSGGFHSLNQATAYESPKE
jgi:hypothetical protein